MEHLKHASDQAGERGGRYGTKKKMKGESSALAFLQSQWALVLLDSYLTLYRISLSI